MPLVRIGRSVVLILDEGRALRPRGSALYDESGSAWPRTSILIAPMREGAGDAKPSAFARKWYGAVEVFKRGNVELPPKALDDWTLEGRCTRIIFDRDGEYADRYEHPFGAVGGVVPGLKTLTFKSDQPKVYRRAGVTRLDGVFNITWRGID